MLLIEASNISTSCSGTCFLLGSWWGEESLVLFGFYFEFIRFFIFFVDQFCLKASDRDALQGKLRAAGVDWVCSQCVDDITSSKIQGSAPS